MAKNSFIKISVFYAKEGITISSGNLTFLGDRIILRGTEFALVPHQSFVEVIGYLQDGIVVMDGKVTVSTDTQLNIDVIKADGKQERRSYLKVQVNMQANLLRAFSLGRRRKAYSINEPIYVRDLSLGGVAFYSNSVLLKKQQLEIDFNPLKPGFTAQAEVLRKERGSFREGYRFKYGCRLLNISGEEERVLCEYVFRKQFEIRNKLAERND